MGKTMFHDVYSKRGGRGASRQGHPCKSAPQEPRFCLLPAQQQWHYPIHQGGHISDGALSPGAPPEFYHVIMDNMNTYGWQYSVQIWQSLGGGGAPNPATQMALSVKDSAAPPSVCKTHDNGTRLRNMAPLQSFPQEKETFFFFLVENIWLSSPPLTLDNYSSSPLIQKNTGIRDSSHYDKSKLLIFFLRGKWMFSFIVILPGWYFAPNSCHQNWWQSSHWCSIHSSGWIPKTLPGNSTVLNDFFFFN